MTLKNLTMPGCMMPDGAAPCDAYQELWQKAVEMSAHAKWLEDENAGMKKELESERRMFNRAIRELAEIAELCGGDENAIAIDCVKDLLAARNT